MTINVNTCTLKASNILNDEIVVILRTSNLPHVINDLLVVYFIM